MIVGFDSRDDLIDRRAKGRSSITVFQLQEAVVEEWKV